MNGLGNSSPINPQGPGEAEVKKAAFEREPPFSEADQRIVPVRNRVLLDVIRHRLTAGLADREVRLMIKQELLGTAGSGLLRKLQIGDTSNVTDRNCWEYLAILDEKENDDIQREVDQAMKKLQTADVESELKFLELAPLRNQMVLDKEKKLIADMLEDPSTRAAIIALLEKTTNSNLLKKIDAGLKLSDTDYADLIDLLDKTEIDAIRAEVDKDLGSMSPSEVDSKLEEASQAKVRAKDRSLLTLLSFQARSYRPWVKEKQLLQNLVAADQSKDPTEVSDEECDELRVYFKAHPKDPRNIQLQKDLKKYEMDTVQMLAELEIGDEGFDKNFTPDPPEGPRPQDGQ